MRAALRRVAGARVPYAPFKCNLEMSGKTGNGWENGIRVSATCAALRGVARRCAAVAGVARRWRALRGKKK